MMRMDLSSCLWCHVELMQLAISDGCDSRAVKEAAGIARIDSAKRGEETGEKVA
jgi:hypothetical protein